MLRYQNNCTCFTVAIRVDHMQVSCALGPYACESCYWLGLVFHCGFICNETVLITADSVYPKHIDDTFRPSIDRTRFEER